MELKKLATKHTIKGRSKMNKAQLEKSLAHHVKSVKKKSRKPAKKKSRKPAKKKSRKPAKKKSRKPAKKKSRKPAKKKSCYYRCEDVELQIMPNGRRRCGTGKKIYLRENP